MWVRGRRGRPLTAVLLGGVVFALGMALGGGGGTYAAYSDFEVFHDSVQAAGEDPALPAVPAACGGLAHAHVRYGTAGSDRLTAYPDARVLMGLEGDDTLLAATGRACLVGGPGHDVCIGTLRVDIFVGCEEVVPPDSHTGGSVPSGPVAVQDPGPTADASSTADPSSTADDSPTADTTVASSPAP